MNMWTAIVIIVVAALAVEAFRHHARNRQAGASQEELDALKARMDELDSEFRDRIQTLERIVTDRQEDLKRQFDHLDETG